MKKLFSKYNLLIATGFVLLSVQACKDSELDVIPRDRLTEANVWTDQGASNLFLNDIYEGLPNGNNWYDPVENWSDNSICGFSWPGSRQMVQQMIINPNAIPGGDVGNIYGWARNYSYIRKCNLFIKNVSASSLPETFKRTSLAEVRVLRAYYYQLLWMAYGGVPIVTDVLAQDQGDAIFKPRNTADETMQFITKECAEVYADLPDAPSSGRIGKATAMVLKGWVELFAKKWGDAAASNKKIIDDLKNYDLDPDYEAFFLKGANASKESIFYREYIATVKGGTIDGKCGPTFTANDAETSWGA
ncbi:RagB/SusD family nutrient uptake outer membrane protein [Pedobacter sp. P26]|uniref:RagB/SusD family nutrient uptake outer membrane protein n=1 Tax=Pedobacter sp. P26 TaxID=3423956 RepID=UPI003D67E321